VKRITPPVIHKAIKRAYQVPRSSFKTRLQRTDLLLPKCPRPTLIPRRFKGEQSPSLQTASKEESAAEFHRWLESTTPLTLIVYSDGSLSSDGAAGYGYAVHQHGRTVCSGPGRLGPAEVFDAEATGALEGLKAALNLPESSNNITVCLDNLAAATCLQGTPSDSSQEKFLSFQDLATSHGATHVRWIPGHTNIRGNEQADILAKAGCALPEPPDAVPTLAYLRRVAKQRPRDAFKAW
jgi:ribonuclease HI